MNKLDEAKINLKKTIEKLEKAVDKKLVVTKSTPALEVMNKVKALQDEVSKLTTEVDDKRDEIIYLREQNAELQASVGEEQHKSIQLETRNREIADRVDRVIVQVQSYMAGKGLV